MKGYSKMTTSRSRSADLSDPFDASFAETPASNLNNRITSGQEAEQEDLAGQMIKAADLSNDLGKLPEQSVSERNDDDSSSFSEKGSVFAAEVVLSRSYSSSVPSKRFEKPSIGAQCSAMKIGFSIRRSSSVSESYSRIHDQSMTLTSQIDEEDEYGGPIIKKKNKGSKIFKACKRIFGL